MPSPSTDFQGDPIRALQARSIISLIRQHSLVEHTASTGDALVRDLDTIFAKNPVIENFRGQGEGTFLSWDFNKPEQRDRFLGLMRNNGVQMGGCGERTVRLRPMLTFGQGHAGVLCETIEKSMGQL